MSDDTDPGLPTPAAMMAQINTAIAAMESQTAAAAEQAVNDAAKARRVNWDKWAAIGSLLGMTALVAYLALDIRVQVEQNTRALHDIRAERYVTKEDHRASLNAIRVGYKDADSLLRERIGRVE